MLEPLLFLAAYGGHIDLVNQLLPLLVESTDSTTRFGIDLSVEGLRSQHYSVGIFVFLVVSLVVFGAIIYIYLPKDGKRLKLGERIMFGAIILGMVCAVIMGWLQLIDGFLL